MVLVLHCISPSQYDVAAHTTEIYRCPNSVRYEYHITPESQAEFMDLRYYEKLANDGGVQAAAKVEPAVASKPVKKSTKTTKKRASKHVARRGKKR